jgi:hypothetical protein
MLGVDYLGVECEVCKRLFVSTRRDHARRTCSDECNRALRQQIGPSDRQRTAARLQGRAASGQLRALDRSAFDVLDELDRELVCRYFALDTEPPSTKAELAERFGLTPWQVSSRLAQAVARLLDPSAPAPMDSAERRRSRARKIAAARRRRDRPAAAALQAVTPQFFEVLPELEQDLVRRYYGVGDERPWSR